MRDIVRKYTSEHIIKITQITPNVSLYILLMLYVILTVNKW